MGYHVVDPAALDPAPDHPCDRRSLDAVADLAALAAAVYEIEPGESLATTYHYHERREEAFYVLAGELHVETPAGEYAVGPDEVFVAEPESPLRPYNPAASETTVRVFGAGAPRSDPGLPYDPGDSQSPRGTDAT